jgi:kumamolisin
MCDNLSRRTQNRLCGQSGLPDEFEIGSAMQASALPAADIHHLLVSGAKAMSNILRTMRERTELPQCRPFFEMLEQPVKARAPMTPELHHADKVWTVPALCKAYGWPAGLAGGGTIGILAMSGGYERSDIEAYFKGLGQPIPDIVDVVVNGSGNLPGQIHDADFDPDVEIALDIEVAGAAYYTATGKPAKIRVYWTDMDLRSMAPAISRAAGDGCTVLSISWGATEQAWEWLHWKFGQNVAVQLEGALIGAAALGMTVFAAAGDREADNGGPAPAVNLPAACPHAVACGGTSKTRRKEVVWNNDPGIPSGKGTGGGYSNLFLPQSWARGAPVGAGRIVPDVSANADKQTGYHIFVHGSDRITGGTSAVAPLYAGLFAAFGKGHGFINPVLWANQDCFQDITEGNNDGFVATRGPDPCSGLGVLIAHELATLFCATEKKTIEAKRVNTKMSKKAKGPVKSKMAKARKALDFAGAV